MLFYFYCLLYCFFQFRAISFYYYYFFKSFSSTIPSSSSLFFNNVFSFSPFPILHLGNCIFFFYKKETKRKTKMEKNRKLLCSICIYKSTNNNSTILQK